MHPLCLPAGRTLAAFFLMAWGIYQESLLETLLNVSSSFDMVYIRTTQPLQQIHLLHAASPPWPSDNLETVDLSERNSRTMIFWEVTMICTHVLRLPNWVASLHTQVKSFLSFTQFHGKSLPAASTLSFPPWQLNMYSTSTSPNPHFKTVLCWLLGKT